MDSLKTQYLSSDILLANIKYKDIKSEDLISADSYHEQMIMDKYNSINEDEKMLLLKCAIHIAVIGSGNKTYGMIRDNKNNVLRIEDVFARNGVKYNRNLSEKYNKDDLSARRLVRLLRYHIQKFITDVKRPSYLWFKYSNKNIDKIAICFPGAEHLIDNEEDADYLYDVYGNIDKIHNTKFQIRLKRVFIARGISKPEKFY